MSQMTQYLGGTTGLFTKTSDSFTRPVTVAIPRVAHPPLPVSLQSGDTKRATSANLPLLRLQSSERKFIIMSRETEPVRRSFRRHGSCTFTEVARLVPSGTGKARTLHQRLGQGAVERHGTWSGALSTDAIDIHSHRMVLVLVIATIAITLLMLVIVSTAITILIVGTLFVGAARRD